MSGNDIDNAHYIQRLLEKKLDKADPEQPFHCRMRDAMAAMDEQFGDKWRHIMKKSGLDVMPTKGEEPQDDSFFSLLQRVSEDEGIGEPPIDIDEKEKEAKVRKHKQDEPTIFILVRKHLGKNDR